jgi:DNA-binding response OmpR family regulator
MSNLLVVSNEYIKDYDLSWLLDYEHNVMGARSTQDAMQLITERDFAVVILGASRADGTSASNCAHLRTAASTSALIVTATEATIEFEESMFAAGADDFLEIPCEPSKLKTHIHSALRLVTTEKRTTLRAGDIELDTAACTVKKAGELVHLFPLEYKLLEFFVGHPNQVFTSEALSQRVWHKDGASDTLRTHIKTLRKKITKPGCPSMIKTEYRRGYKLVTSTEQ